MLYCIEGLLVMLVWPATGLDVLPIANAAALALLLGAFVGGGGLLTPVYAGWWVVRALLLNMMDGDCRMFGSYWLETQTTNTT